MSAHQLQESRRPRHHEMNDWDIVLNIFEVNDSSNIERIDSYEFDKQYPCPEFSSGDYKYHAFPRSAHPTSVLSMDFNEPFFHMIGNINIADDLAPCPCNLSMEADNLQTSET